MKHKKAISGIVLLVIVAVQAIITLGTYVSLKYQIDDPAYELSNNVISNVHVMVNTLALIIVTNWAIIGIMFTVILIAHSKNKITNK